MKRVPIINLMGWVISEARSGIAKECINHPQPEFAHQFCEEYLVSRFESERLWMYVLPFTIRHGIMNARAAEKS